MPAARSLPHPRRPRHVACDGQCRPHRHEEQPTARDHQRQRRHHHDGGDHHQRTVGAGPRRRSIQSSRRPERVESYYKILPDRAQVARFRWPIISRLVPIRAAFLLSAGGRGFFRQVRPDAAASGRSAFPPEVHLLRHGRLLDLERDRVGPSTSRRLDCRWPRPWPHHPASPCSARCPSTCLQMPR